MYDFRLTGDLGQCLASGVSQHQDSLAFTHWKAGRTPLRKGDVAPGNCDVAKPVFQPEGIRSNPRSTRLPKLLNSPSKAEDTESDKRPRHSGHHGVTFCAEHN